MFCKPAGSQTIILPLTLSSALNSGREERKKKEELMPPMDRVLHVHMFLPCPLQDGNATLGIEIYYPKPYPCIKYSWNAALLLLSQSDKSKNCPDSVLGGHETFMPPARCVGGFLGSILRITVLGELTQSCGRQKG